MKNKLILIVLIAISLIIVNSAVAAVSKSKVEKSKVEKPKAEKSYPTGCKITGFNYSYGTLVLTPDKTRIKQAIYFIQNNSNKDIAFFDERDGSAPYIIHHDNTLQAGQWGVFATDTQTKFICSKAEKSTTMNSLLDCKDIIKVCEYANVKFAANNRGSYWATTNMSMSAAVREIIHQGILLKS